MNNPTPDPYQPFAHFMQAYQDMVFSTAARLLANREQAEDIVQDVFLKAYERFDQLQDSATAGGWLKTVATHLALNHLSRHRRRWRLFSELRTDHDDAALPELDWPLPDTLLDRLQDQQHQRLLEHALQQLPEQQRVPLVLFHFEEMSYQQIAQQLQVSLANCLTPLVLNKRFGKSIVMVTHAPKAAEYASRQLHVDKGPLADSQARSAA